MWGDRSQAIPGARQDVGRFVAEQETHRHEAGATLFTLDKVQISFPVGQFLHAVL